MAFQQVELGQCTCHLITERDNAPSNKTKRRINIEITKINIRKSMETDAFACQLVMLW